MGMDLVDQEALLKPALPVPPGLSQNAPQDHEYMYIRFFFLHTS